jgi:sodium/hydrogen exchanger-like protein 6/7
LKFDDEIFFTFILPPIIFAAGYNLRRRSFFKYFLYIFLFGVVGTMLCFSTVAPLTYLANKHHLFRVTYENKGRAEVEIRHLSVSDNSKENTNELPIDPAVYESTSGDGDVIEKEEGGPIILDFSVKQILLFSAVISATDTVAALTFIKEESEPKLFAILFGEGVINDAVCIVLYGIIKNLAIQGSIDFSPKLPFTILGSFLNMFFFSFLVGFIVGCLCSLFLKKLKPYNLNRVQETSIIVFFAFISYTLTEELGLSPIIALLFNGIIMSHYAFYNLSFQAREESSVVTRIMSNIAEAFVFTYLGLTVIYYLTNAFSFSFILWETIFVFLGRVVSIYGIGFLMNYLKFKSFNLRTSHMGIMTFSGSIRGAIAFGLAISIPSKNKLNKYL